MWYIYRLLDYKGFPFYVGITKNLVTRIAEHSQCKSASPDKNYRVRRCIETYGTLKYDYFELATKKEALSLEKELINRYKLQLVNVQHGIKEKRKAKTRKAGRSKQCPYCLNWYRRIGAHRCKHVKE